MLHLSNSQDLKRTETAILQVAKDLALGRNLDFNRTEAMKVIRDAVLSTDAADEYNKALFAGIKIRSKLADLGITINPRNTLDLSSESVPSLLTGIILSPLLRASSAMSLSERSFRLPEYDRSGEEISEAIHDATAKLYSLLVGQWRSNFPSGILDLRDQQQVFRTLSYLIAANMSSDANPIIGAHNAALAIHDHFSRRALLAFHENNLSVITGVIYESFISPCDQEAPTITDLREETFSHPPKSVLEATVISAPEEVGESRLVHNQNRHHLTQDQYRFIVNLIEAASDLAQDLDTPHNDAIFEGVSDDARELIGSDILGIDGFSDDTSDDLKLGDRDSRVTTSDLLKAIQSRFEHLSSTANLDKSYLCLVADVLNELRQAILERVAYQVSPDFFDDFEPQTLRELAEDLLCSYNDPMGTIEDKGAITPESMAQEYDLLDCLEAMSFRLKSIATG